MRRLGRTGLNVSAMGLGAIRFGEVSQDVVSELVGAALDSGINLIDTARVYDDSEEKIGRALAGRRDEMILVTKSGARTADEMRRDIETSLRALRTERIDVYLAHNLRVPAEFDKAMGTGGAIEALERAREEGLIGHVGLSCHRYQETAERAILSGRFSFIMVAYNIMNDELMDRRALPLAKKEGVGTLIMKPLGGGFLAEAPDKIRLKGEGVPARPLTVVDAIRFVLANENVDCAVVGMKSVAELRADLPAVEGAAGEREMAAMVAAVQELTREFCHACGYCQPCPNGILTPVILRHLFYAKEFGMEAWARRRYSMVEVKADKCERCGKCEEKCPYDLPIADLLEEAHRLLGK